MIVSHKVALSLLISVVLFALITIVAFSGLFNVIEARFYNPSITRALNQEVIEDAESVQNFLTELQARFSATMEDEAIRRSFQTTQNDADILARSRLYGMLHESLSGLQSVRFIDAGGSRIHFSTYAPDILRQDRTATAFRNYTDEQGYLPYEDVAVPARGTPKITLDAREERLIFSFPFTDTFDVYRGTALFSLSVRAVTERLISEGKIKAGEDVSVISAPPGIVTGIPHGERSVILPMVASVWQDGVITLTVLDAADSQASLTLISSRTNQGIYIGRLVAESVFSFPPAMKIILLGSVYLTVFLTIFLLFNFRQDSMTVIQNRLKRLQVTLIEEYYEHKNDMDWTRWRRELEQRREDVRTELKRGIKASGKDGDINSFIDKSWDDLLAVIGGRRERIGSGIDEEKLQLILSRVLAAGGAAALPPAQTPAAAALKAEAAPKAGEPVEAEALEPMEELEEAEPAEELESLDAAEPVEELAEAESAEELESLDAAEPVEELEEAPAEELEELGSAAADTADKQDQRQSNLRLVFGDDDIPTIVETSGLELVDEDVDSVLSTMRPDDEPGDLEELDADEPEDLQEEKSPEPGLSGDAYEDLASKIEFADTDDDTTDAAGSELLDKEIEIVSPFAAMLSDFEKDETGAPSKKSRSKKGSGGLEDIDSAQMSLFYKPFSGGGGIDRDVLETENNKNSPADSLDVIIEERDGINYVNKNILSPTRETENKLDPDFKNLINSVLKK